MNEENMVKYNENSVFSFESNRLMNTQEACSYLGYKRGTLYNLVSKGMLKPFKRGQKAKGNLRFIKSDLDRFLGRTQCQSKS